jgi:ankyrin repeat protein
MIEILLANGIDTNTVIRPKVGDKTWFRSSPKPSLDPVLQYGKSTLGSAIVTDNTSDLKIVQRLLRGGADPNGVVTDDDETRTALLEAIKTKNLVLVKTLIEAGAGPNLSNIPRVKRTPLQQAAEQGAMDIIKLLLEYGAEVNAPPHDDHGATALQFAAIGGYVGIAHLLIERGADVNSPPAKRGGRTALEAAAEHGRIDMLQLLLISGAMIIGPGLEQYERAREFASGQGHLAARRLLEKCNDELCKVSETLDPMSTAFSDLFDESQL